MDNKRRDDIVAKNAGAAVKVIAIIAIALGIIYVVAVSILSMLYGEDDCCSETADYDEDPDIFVEEE